MDDTKTQKRTKYPKAKCPECGSTNLRHRLYSRWHECKICFARFSADCTPHKHGGVLQ